METIISNIIQKNQDRFLVAYNRFLAEVRQELAIIQKEYNTEILKKQTNTEMTALFRSLEWFKQEGKLRMVNERPEVVFGSEGKRQDHFQAET